MITVRVLVFSLAAVAATASTTYAGPCSNQIDAVQARFDAKLEAKAAAGPTAKQGVAAGMSTRACAADTAGDKSGCEQALADAQRAIGP